jgi:hypothetical protein
MTRLRLIRRLLRRYAQIDSRRRALLAEAALCLLAARAALILVPFPQLARHLGTFVPPNDAKALRARMRGAAEHVRVIENVGWAVTCMARYVPFKAVCLPQAMAARIMLTRRGVRSVMHFGAASDRKHPLAAHAWLDAEGVKVTGYPLVAGFTEIASFVEDPDRAWARRRSP